MEKRVVKLNLKIFTEDLLYAYISNDDESIKELDEKFISFISHQECNFKEEIFNYLMKYKLVLDNDCLVKYFSKFLC